MTHAKQIKKNDEFKLVMSYSIKGHKSRATILRLNGMPAALSAVGATVAPKLIVRAP